MGIILAVLAALEGLLERLRLVLGRREGILDRLGGIFYNICYIEAPWWGVPPPLVFDFGRFVA